jgi:hypothetical protein
MPTYSGADEVGPSWQGAKWLAVLSSVWATVVQVASRTQGGVQDTTRQEIRPLHPIS